MQDFQIQTERLSLNEVTWNDLEDVHWLHSFPEVDRYNTLGLPETLVETREVIRNPIEDQKKNNRSEFFWTIRISDKDMFIGVAGMKLAEEKFKMAEIYYKLAPRFWGHGYASETARALLEFGFETLKLHRIEAGTDTQNSGSIRVLEKIGMTREGLRRKILPIRGEWRDNYHFAILEDDVRL